MTDPARPRVYLAGPEVFLPDALEILKEKAALARAAGFDPVTPLDNESLPQGRPFDTGLAIYRSNVRLMDGCDLIIANLTPFRGVGADPGTGVLAVIARAFLNEMRAARKAGRPMI